MAALPLTAVGGTRGQTSLRSHQVSNPVPKLKLYHHPDQAVRVDSSRGVGRGKTYVALAADVLLAVVLGGEGLERGLNDTTTETEDKVKGRLL